MRRGISLWLHGGVLSVSSFPFRFELGRTSPFYPLFQVALLCFPFFFLPILEGITKMSHVGKFIILVGGRKYIFITLLYNYNLPRLCRVNFIWNYVINLWNVDYILNCNHIRFMNEITCTNYRVKFSVESEQSCHSHSHFPFLTIAHNGLSAVAILKSVRLVLWKFKLKIRCSLGTWSYQRSSWPAEEDAVAVTIIWRPIVWPPEITWWA